MATKNETTIQNEVESKAKAFQAQVEKERADILTAAQALQRAILAAGPAAQDAIADDAGYATNDKGETEFATWLRLVLVLTFAKPDFNRHNALLNLVKSGLRRRMTDAGKTQQQVQDAIAKVVKSKAKGDSKGGIGCKLSLAAPKAWDVAILN